MIKSQFPDLMGHDRSVMGIVEWGIKLYTGVWARFRLSSQLRFFHNQLLADAAPQSPCRRQLFTTSAYLSSPGTWKRPLHWPFFAFVVR